MVKTNEIEGFFPNRPDALGIFPDSGAYEDPKSPYNRNRYAAAIARLVDRLVTKANIVSGENIRGKRRKKLRPQDQSATLRTYLKAIELWSYYCVALYGRELEPRETTSDRAIEFAKWMAAEGPGPDIRGMYIRALGGDFGAIYGAMMKACAAYGDANIVQIAEMLPTDARDRLVTIVTDARRPVNLFNLHKMLGRIVRSLRSVVRKPTIADLRFQERETWGERERDPYTYTYALIPRKRLSSASVSTYIGSLSAVWSEMSKPSEPDDPPMFFNPWKSVYADWNYRMRMERQNAIARGDSGCMKTPMVRAMLNACMGVEVENRRDALAINILLFMGLRAEELAGVLRSDLRSDGSILSLVVLGKGNKVRVLPFDSVVRDALTLFTGRLEQDARKTQVTNDGNVAPTYEARYAAALLKPEAPLVPSLLRWGCNMREEPEKCAIEPLDTSGVRAMVAKIADRARVRVVATGEIRAFTDDERSLVHPHAFRHYAATAAKQAGIDLQEIKVMLGHERINTTEGYVAVSVQMSAAFAAGIYQIVNRVGPLTSEQIAGLRTSRLSPLDDPTIVEAEPSTDTSVRASVAFPLNPQERQQKISSPVWAYEKSDAMLAYLPGVTAKKFSAEVKTREIELERAIEETKRVGDAQNYAAAVREYANVRARHLWTTFRLGKLSRLPWWAGRSNRWPVSQMAPIISYAQIAPENEIDSSLIKELKALYEHFYAQRGPSAATALGVWLGEIVNIVGIQFSLAMQERQDGWIPFDAESPPTAPVVREHLGAAILSWFEKFGGAYQASGYKSATNRGNVGIAALESLPDWFWVPDPLTDNVRGLTRPERSELRAWVTGLQGMRPSKIRFEQWIEQISVRVSAWARAYAEFAQRSGVSWRWASTYSSQEGASLANEALSIAREFDTAFPKIFPSLDIAAVVESVGKGATQAEIQARITSILSQAGINVANPEKITLGPVITARAGASHMFDPALLTFNEADTIVHDESIKKFWFERYGTDSECVVKRALRVLWERRKGAARSQARGLVTRHFDMWLSSIIPCPEEIEARIAAAGWTPPKTIGDVVTASKVLWAGVCDYVRAQQGIPELERVPPETVETFWSSELPEFVSFVETTSEAQMSVTEGTPEADAALTAIILDADQQTPEPTMPATAFQAEIPSLPLAPIQQEQKDIEEKWDEPVIKKTTEEAREDKQKSYEKRFEEAQRASASISSSAIKSVLGWTIDREQFWQFLNTPAKWVVFTTGAGDAAVMESAFLRRLRAATRKLKPTIYWDEKKQVLRVRWRNGLGGLNLFTSSRLPESDTFSVVSLVDSDMFNNPPVWRDPQPWAPMWPSYPAPDPEDAQEPELARIPWPLDRFESALSSARYDGCLREYAQWKRSKLRANGGRLPGGWKVPPQPSELSVRPGQPHPIDIILASVRST